MLSMLCYLGTILVDMGTDLMCHQDNNGLLGNQERTDLIFPPLQNICPLHNLILFRLCRIAQQGKDGIR